MSELSATDERWTPLEALLARTARAPETAALVVDGEVWSQARLATESGILADAFLARGVHAGERIALHMHNLPELVAAYLACWHIGAIAVPLNTRFKAAELTTAFDRIRPALYLGQAELHDGIRTIDLDVLPSDRRFLVDATGSSNGARSWAELRDPAMAGDEPRSRPARSIERGAPAALLATSGTTGQSKLVVWTHGNLAGLISSAESRGAGAQDVFEIGVPMMHASGLWSMSACLLTGALMVLIPRFDADAMLDAVEKHRCTTTGGMPFMCAGLANGQRARARDVSSLRVCLSSADACPAATEKAFESAFARPLLSFWGATEDMAAAMPGSEPGPLIQFVAGAEVRLVDTGGAPAARGEAGEMLVRSAGTTPGYWMEPGRIEPLPGGWFHSGDLVQPLGDGQLRFVGRTKDLIVRGGSNVSPFEVEAALRQQPCVIDAAVAGIPDPELGERVGAMLVLANGTTEEVVPDILKGVRLRLADYKVPDVVVITDAIPRNALMKVDRHAVGTVVSGRASLQ